MDALFVANVPDLSGWGNLSFNKQDAPRRHLCRTIDITVQQGAPDYTRIVHEVAHSIASARLDNHYLKLWEEAVVNKRRLSKSEREIIARALARGVSRSGSTSMNTVPLRNDNLFMAHLVEVILFCLRVYLANSGHARPQIFEPPRPKASPATPGIDLLEIGEGKQGYYFHIWECKGTDANARAALAEAASQLCAENGTAYQGFMEAYRCLQMNNILGVDKTLAEFVSNMPRMFYGSSTHRSKRLGGIVGTNSNHAASHADSFANRVGNSAAGQYAHCQVVVVSIAKFPQFREDVFQHLWNIF